MFAGITNQSGCRRWDGLRRSSLATGLVLGLSILVGVFAAGAETIEWVNPSGGNWHDAANWNPQNVPNGAGEHALFPDGGGEFETVLNGSCTLDSVTVANPGVTVRLVDGISWSLSGDTGLKNAGTVQGGVWATLAGNMTNMPGATFAIPGGAPFYLTGPELINNGAMLINSDQSSSNAILYISAFGMQLLGEGELVLATAGDPADAQILYNYGDLTQGTGHTIRGTGYIGAVLTNNGLITADVDGQELILDGNQKTNNGIMKATNNGVLRIISGPITQGSTGVILGDGGTVTLAQPATITGGSFNTVNGGQVQSTSYNYLTDITNLGDYDLAAGAVVYMYGAEWTNDGTITVNTNGSGTNTVMYVSSYDLSLVGSGRLEMRTSGSDANDAALHSYYGSLIQGPDHTIAGEGKIGAFVTNNGTIDADVEGRTLVLSDNTKTNNATIKASNNGILQITNGQIAQGPGGVIMGDGGTVDLAQPATIAGGSFNTMNGGQVWSTSYNYLTDITNLGNYDLMGGAAVYMYGTEWTNEGTITINKEGSGTNAGLYVSSYDLSLVGSGRLELKTSGGDLNDAMLNSNYGSLIQGPDHTIAGEGKIGAFVTNNGTIDADVDGRVLLLSDNPKTNNGTMKASNNGILQIANGQITQGESGILLADGGVIEFANPANVVGGTLNSANGGVVRSTSYTYLTAVTNQGDFDIMGGAPVYVYGSTWTNNGTITINRNQSSNNSAIYLGSYDLLLTGTGSVVMQTAGTGDLWDALIGYNYGSVIQDVDHTIRGEGVIEVPLLNRGLIVADSPGRTLQLSSYSKTNEGTIRAENHGLLSNTGPLQNNGVVAAADSGVYRSTNHANHYAGGVLTGGTWLAQQDGTIRLIGSPISTCNAGIILEGSNSNFTSDDGTSDALAGLSNIGDLGHFEIRSGRDFTTAGDLNDRGSLVVGEACSLTVTGRYTHQGRDFYPHSLINGVLVSPDTAIVENGTLGGHGVIATDLVNRGRVNPGASAGTLTIDGDYAQTSEGWLELELSGSGEGEYDRLAITGTAALAGTLYVMPIEDFAASEGETFEVMTFTSRSGDFDKVYGCPGPGYCVELLYTDTSLFLVAHAVDAADVEEPDLDSPDVDDPGSDLPSEIRFASRVIVGGCVALDLDLPTSAEVDVTLFDIAGRRVATVHRGSESAGRYTYGWSGRSDSGRRLTSGVYFGRAAIRMEETAVVRKARVLLVR